MKESINIIKEDLSIMYNAVISRPYLTFLFGVFTGLGIVQRVIIMTTR